MLKLKDIIKIEGRLKQLEMGYSVKSTTLSILSTLSEAYDKDRFTTLEILKPSIMALKLDSLLILLTVSVTCDYVDPRLKEWKFLLVETLKNRMKTEKFEALAIKRMFYENTVKDLENMMCTSTRVDEIVLDTTDEVSGDYEKGVANLIKSMKSILRLYGDSNDIDINSGNLSSLMGSKICGIKCSDIYFEDFVGILDFYEKEGGLYYSKENLNRVLSNIGRYAYSMVDTEVSSKFIWNSIIFPLYLELGSFEPSSIPVEILPEFKLLIVKYKYVLLRKIFLFTVLNLNPEYAEANLDNCNVVQMFANFLIDEYNSSIIAKGREFYDRNDKRKYSD